MLQIKIRSKKIYEIINTPLSHHKNNNMSNTIENSQTDKEDSKYFDFPLSSNRDFTRVNRACATLQANVMSLISTESLKNIRDTILPKKRKTTNDTDDITSDKRERLSTLVNLALDTNQQSKDLFNKCQRTVSKVVAE